MAGRAGGPNRAGPRTVGPFIDNTLDRGPPVRNVEAENAADFTQPLSPFVKLYKLLTGLFG